MIEFALNVLWWYGVVVIISTIVLLFITLRSSERVKLNPILVGLFLLYVASHMQNIHSAEMEKRDALYAQCITDGRKAYECYWFLNSR